MSVPQQPPLEPLEPLTLEKQAFLDTEPVPENKEELARYLDRRIIEQLLYAGQTNSQAAQEALTAFLKYMDFSEVDSKKIDSVKLNDPDLICILSRIINELKKDVFYGLTRAGKLSAEAMLKRTQGDTLEPKFDQNAPSIQEPQQNPPDAESNKPDQNPRKPKP